MPPTETKLTQHNQKYCFYRVKNHALLAVVWPASLLRYDFFFSGKGKKAKVKSAPSASPAPKVKAEPVASPKSVPEQLPSSKAKNRQPLQEHNAELAVKAEPGSIHKSPGHSGLQRRTLAAWSDDED